MASTQTVLQDERPKRPGEFTFTWSIHNYSYCTLEEYENLCSPDFVVEFLGKDVFYLMLSPRDIKDGAPGFMSFGLSGRDREGDFYFTLSIRKTDGQFKEGNESIYNENKVSISVEELKGPSEYLVNDTLTLRCRIWKTDTEIPTSVKCDVHSKIKVSKLNYIWLLKDIAVSNDASECEFDKSTDITNLLNGIRASKMHLINKESLSERDIYFGIEMESLEETFFLNCEVHFLDANRKVVHSASSQQLFLYCDQIGVFKFPVISKHKFYLNKNVYAPRGQLTLQCQFRFATDQDLETIDYIEQRMMWSYINYH